MCPGGEERSVCFLARFRHLKKLKELMADYEVQQGFVYDYKRNVWYRCEPDKENCLEDSYSTVIRHKLENMLDIGIEF